MDEFYTRYTMTQIEITKRHTFTGHTSGIFCLQPYGANQFVSAGGDGQIVKWHLDEAEEGKVIAKVNSSIYGMLTAGDRMVVGENSRAIHLIDLIDNKVLRSVELKSPVFAIEKVGERYLIGTGAGEVFTFDESLNFIGKLKHSNKSLRTIATGNGELAMGYSDNIIRIVDAESLEVKYELAGHKLSIFALAYDPVTGHLLSTGRDARIISWDTFDHYSLQQDIPAHNYACNHLVFRPDGKYFATGSMDKTIKIWDATTFTLLKVIDKARYDGHGNSVNKLLWMDFDNLLVTCSDDRTIAVWDIKID
jgi:WD40 repeat protein